MDIAASSRSWSMWLMYAPLAKWSRCPENQRRGSTAVPLAICATHVSGALITCRCPPCADRPILVAGIRISKARAL